MTATSPIEPPRRLHPLSPLLSAMAAAPRFLVPFVVLATTRWVIVIVVGAAAVLAAGFVSHVRTTYQLTDEQLIHRSGWWQRSTKIISPDRVQTVELIRKLRHQATRTVMVRIELAGSAFGGGRVDLDAVDEAEATRIQEVLERGRRRSMDIAAPADIPPPPPSVLLTVPTRDLVIGGLTGASLLFVPIAIITFADEVTDVAGDQIDVDQVRSAPLAVLLLGGLFVVGAIAAGQSVLRHHRLTLTRSGADLRAERGLLERRSSVIPVRRVQLVDVSATFVRRWVGLHSVDVKTASGANGDGAGSVDDTIPVARIGDVERVAPLLLGRTTFPAAASSHPPAARRRAIARRATGLAVLAAVASLATTSWTVGAGGFIAAVVLGLVWGDRWSRRLRHGIDADGDAASDPSEPRVLVVESGVVIWHRRVVPLGRVQSVSIRQTPFQRRVGLVTLSLDLAATSPVVVRDVDRDRALDLVRALERMPVPMPPV
jgi:putative membrane protein